jgi:hypothetical protein
MSRNSWLGLVPLILRRHRCWMSTVLGPQSQRDASSVLTIASANRIRPKWNGQRNGISLRSMRDSAHLPPLGAAVVDTVAAVSLVTVVAPALDSGWVSSHNVRALASGSILLLRHHDVSSPQR